MKAACDKVITGDNADMDCFAGQYDKYEGLTCNFAEAVQSAGGTILGEDGKPTVNTPEAAKGLDRLANWFKDGTIPQGAITWKEENGRTAFQDGTLGLPSQLAVTSTPAPKVTTSPRSRASSPSRRSRVRPARAVSSLGGHNMAIAKYGKNKGTAVEFAKWWSSRGAAEAERSRPPRPRPALERSTPTPSWSKKFPYHDMRSSRSRPRSRGRRPSSTAT